MKGPLNRGGAYIKWNGPFVLKFELMYLPEMRVDMT